MLRTKQRNLSFEFSPIQDKYALHFRVVVHGLSNGPWVGRDEGTVAAAAAATAVGISRHATLNKLLLAGALAVVLPLPEPVAGRRLSSTPCHVATWPGPSFSQVQVTLVQNRPSGLRPARCAVHRARGYKQAARQGWRKP